MESVGQKLRAARMQLGIALEEISARTRISVRNLQALENDDLKPFNSAFFYKSFVRQFAQHVKIDYRELASGVESVTSGIPQPLMPGQAELTSPNPKVPALHPKRPKKLRWLYSLTSLMVMLVACSSFNDLWENFRPQWQSKISGVLQLATQHAAQPSSPRITDPSQISEAPIRPPANASVAVHLQLSAIERSWLSIMADGVQTFNGFLEPDQTKILEGRQVARIRAGDAGALNVVFNGKEIGSLGPRGQVRTVIFTKNGYETLETAPSPVAHLFLTPFIQNGE